MNLPLKQAFAQMDLQPGQIYRFRVKGRRVELRVLDEAPAQPPPSDEGGVMLEPWVEFPDPPGFRSRSRLAAPEPPDVPEIPPVEDLQ